MKNFLKQNKYLVTALTLVVVWFLWFQIRPVMIKKSCADFAMSKSLNEDKTTWDPAEYDDQFKRCTREKGL